jgi:DNA replication protein DnaC
MRDLATCHWIRKKHNVIVVGKTGVGKASLGDAGAQAACRKGLRAMCVRVPRLAHELAIARADGAGSVAVEIPVGAVRPFLPMERPPSPVGRYE